MSSFADRGASLERDTTRTPVLTSQTLPDAHSPTAPSSLTARLVRSVDPVRSYLVIAAQAAPTVDGALYLACTTRAEPSDETTTVKRSS